MAVSSCSRSCAQALGLLLGLSLCGGKLLLYLLRDESASGISLAASGIDLTLRLGSGGKRHLLGLVRRGELPAILQSAHRERLNRFERHCAPLTRRLSFVIFALQLRTQIVNLALELCVFLLRIRTGLNSCTLACTLTRSPALLELGAQLGKFHRAWQPLVPASAPQRSLLDKLSIALRLCLLQGSRQRERSSSSACSLSRWTAFTRSSGRAKTRHCALA
ncbi:MAG: hypothetical protein ACLU37_02010 [Collinsella sp.]